MLFLGENGVVSADALTWLSSEKTVVMATQEVVSRPSATSSTNTDLSTAQASQGNRNSLQKEMSETRSTVQMVGDPTKEIEVEGRSVYTDRNLAILKKLGIQPKAPGIDATIIPQYPEESLNVSVLRTPRIGEVRIHTPTKSFATAEKGLNAALNLLDVIENQVGTSGAQSLTLAQLPGDKLAMDLKLKNGASVTKLLSDPNDSFSKADLDMVRADIKKAMAEKSDSSAATPTGATSTPQTSTTPAQQKSGSDQTIPASAKPPEGPRPAKPDPQQTIPATTKPPEGPRPAKSESPKEEPSKTAQEKKGLSGLDKLSRYDAELATALQKKGIISDAAIQSLVDKLGSKAIGQSLFQDSIAGALALSDKKAAAHFEKVLAQGGAHALEKAKLTKTWDYRPL